MLHHMKLHAKPFEMIRSGAKTYELRLLDEKRQKLCAGDVIEFRNSENKKEIICARISALHKFDSFEELYASLPLFKCGYTEEDVADGSPADMEKYYSQEEQTLWGVVGIELELLETPNLIKTSKYISLILRHKPEVAGITLDKNGWANVSELIRSVGKTHPIDMALLEKIVAEDDKQRYSFNEDKTLIRANQGHSIPVDVELEEMEPPEYLWHGTADRYVPGIEKSGLISKSRLYVHLSPDYKTAKKVGSRHGSPVIFRVKTGQMYADGYRFFKSVNNVWLTKYVSAYYLEKQPETE